LTSFVKIATINPIVRKTNKKDAAPNNNRGKILMAQFIGSVDL